jgi:hypothetical protein
LRRIVAEIERQLRRAPRQRDAAAAVAVIVHQRFVAERFARDTKTAGPIRPKANIEPDDPLFRDQHRRQAHGAPAAPARDADVAHQAA